ncbi:MAG: RluA family pseudouridine synthase [Planctomycetota bacterium]
MVERDLAGIRLFDLLARSHPDVHRGDLRQLLSSGGVSVNGELCLHDCKLRLGDVVMLDSVPGTRRRSAKARGQQLTVLRETASALVVAKPAGMPSVPDRSGKEAGVHGLLETLRPDGDLRIVHRLDRNTSGCLILAKGADAARHFDVEFRERRVRKTYVALVAGVPTWNERSVNSWLGPDRRRPGMVLASGEERTGFREAHTDVSVRERYGRHSLLELRPTTGRGHQIRVHLQSIGYPIVGDVPYGGERLLLSRLKAAYKKRTGVEERPLLERMFLHAEQVVFFDVDGTEVVADAPMPEDLAVALRHVEKHRSPRRTQCD